MEKESGIKNDPRYNTRHLRRRVLRAVKRPCDDGGETKHPQGKQYLVIPVTGRRKPSKFIDNKGRTKF